MGNAKLFHAKKAKNDEFYTQYADIQREMAAYTEYDPDVFRGKTVLLPCDDPEISQFTGYFVRNFNALGLQKLISTCRGTAEAVSGAEGPESCGRGKCLVLTREEPGAADGTLHKWTYLEGSGDFRSPEVTALREEADIIITNPPFSLFREFLAWVTEGDKRFSVIGSLNAITYKEIFPLILQNRLWLGAGFQAGNAYFRLMDGDTSGYADNVYDRKTGLVKFRNCCWFTNLEHGKRHQPLLLRSMEDNLRYGRHKVIKERGYQRYDNFDALEVPFTDAIPGDYDGVMGVPISFLQKYCPEQFEILGLLQSSTDAQAGIPNLRYYDSFVEMRRDLTKTGASGKKINGNPVLKGRPKRGNFFYDRATAEVVHSVYARIAIRKK